MSDLIVNVRQISNYPAQATATGTEMVLLQQTGLGGPYVSITSADLVATALARSGSIGVGIGGLLPGDVGSGQVFTNAVALPSGGYLGMNFYVDFEGTQRYLNNGPAGALEWDPAAGFAISLATAGSAQQVLGPFSNLLSISPAGNMVLPYGTLTVARDPASSFDVATLNYVSNHTVASFNQRIGHVQLNQNDIYSALCLDSPIASQNYVNQAITTAFQDYLWTCPVVTTWNGRKGQVYLTLSDITCVFFQPGQQPISPTPPITSNDNSIATTAWVTAFLENELEGSGGVLATQSWVLANTVNSFNGRQGVVTLTSADVFDVGAAPTNSPNFSGVPTAPTANVGQATGQIATTAFVMQAITANTAGVSTFMGRSGDVILITADVTAAGGLTNPSANLTGSPTAPTATIGASTPQIANTEFVTRAVNGAVTSFNSRTGAVTLIITDILAVGGAPLANPTFTGVPAAPTASPGTATTQLATTQFVTAAITAAGGVSSFNGRTGVVDLIPNDISAAGGLVNPSVALTGTPTAPTAAPATNTTQIATTGFVQAALAAGAVTSFNTRTGAITLTSADLTSAGGALLASPTFSGVPTAPTAAPATNNTQLATTAFVTQAVAGSTAGVTSWNTRTGAVTFTLADLTAAGGAPINNAALTGTPTAPTAAPGTATTQLATTGFVAAALAGGGVTSFNGRSGAVTLLANDISAASGALLASPSFTGTPAAPTASPGTNTTQLATTAFVTAAVNAVGAGFLPTSGGTMTGPITLAADAAQPLQPASLQQTQAIATTISGFNIGRNYIDNARFNTAQRGLGPFTANNAYTSDRWQIAFAGGSMSVTVAALVDTDRSQIGDESAAQCWQCVFTGGAANGNYSQLIQKIESLRRLSGRIVTVSFWAKSNATLRIGLNLMMDYGTGGTPSPTTYVQATGVGANTTTAWARFAFSFTIPSTAGQTFGTNGDSCMRVIMALNAVGAVAPGLGNPGQQSGTISIWGVQLELVASITTPPTVTPLEQLNPSDDILRCQRYYTALNGFSQLLYAPAGQATGSSVTWPTVMRATPTVTFTAPSYTNGSGLTASPTNTGTMLYFTVTAVGMGQVTANVLASADL